MDEFVKRLAVGAGLALLCAAPELILAQSAPAGAVAPTRIRSTPAQRPTFISPTEYLSGLTLNEDQKTKINQIEEDTKAHFAAVGKEPKLEPEVKEAMIGGYQRIENSRIFAVLTAEQQQKVRTRIASLRAAAQQPKHSAAPLPAPARTPESK